VNGNVKQAARGGSQWRVAHGIRSIAEDKNSSPFSDKTCLVIKRDFIALLCTWMIYVVLVTIGTLILSN